MKFIPNQLKSPAQPGRICPRCQGKGWYPVPITGYMLGEKFIWKEPCDCDVDYVCGQPEKNGEGGICHAPATVMSNDGFGRWTCPKHVKEER